MGECLFLQTNNTGKVIRKEVLVSTPSHNEHPGQNYEVAHWIRVSIFYFSLNLSPNVIIKCNDVLQIKNGTNNILCRILMEITVG